MPALAVVDRHVAHSAIVAVYDDSVMAEALSWRRPAGSGILTVAVLVAGVLL